MAECSQCGECCRWFVVCAKKGLTPKQRSYLRTRCDRETSEYFLLDSLCQHAHRNYKKEGQPMECDIYEDRPQMCKEFCGRKFTNGNVYYVPQGCTMSERIP